jgi:hypothetical protein
MLEVIAGVVIVITFAIALSVVVAGLSVFIGAARNVDSGAIYEEDE